MATGLGEERHVVPASLVTAGAAQVEHPHATSVTALRVREVAARCQDGCVRKLEPALILISDDKRFHPRTWRHARWLVDCVGPAPFTILRKHGWNVGASFRVRRDRSAMTE